MQTIHLRLISLNIYKSGLIEPPYIYFNQLQSLLRKNSFFYRCLTDIIPEIGFERKELVEELSSPYIWGDEEKLKKALKKNKNNDFYNYLLGRFYYEKNLFAKAVEPLERAKEINPKNVDILKLLGTIYDADAKTREDLEKAIKYLKEARDLNPSNHDILWRLGTLELALGDYCSSIKNVKKSSLYVKTDSDKCITFAILSEAYRMKKIFDKSKDYLEKSNKISDSYTEAILEWLRGFIKERAELK